MPTLVVLFTNIILFFVALVIYFFFGDLDYSSNLLSVVVFIMLLSTFMFFFKVERDEELRGNYFKAATIFILGYLIVHFQAYIDLLLGNISENYAFIFTSPDVIVKSSLISLLGLLSFYLGYLSYRDKDKSGSYNLEYKYTYPVGILIALTYPCLFLFFSTVGLSYIMGGYGSLEIEAGSAVAYFELLLQLLFYAIMILNYLNARARDIKYTLKEYFLSYNSFFYISFGAYLIMVLLSGDRGPIISLGLGYVLTYSFIAKSKISFRQFTLMIFIAAFVITILGVARTFSIEGHSFKEKIVLALSEDVQSRYESFSPNTNELAVSIRTLHQAVDYVPEKHPYMNGLFQFKYILSSVPLLSGFLSPVFDPHYKYKGSASFLTWVEQGNFPTSGAGSTCVADIYLDFGLVGVIILFFLFGYLVRWSEYQLFLSNSVTLFSYVLCFYLTVISFYISRSSIMFHFRSVIWLFLMILIYQYIFKRDVER